MVRGDVAFGREMERGAKMFVGQGAGWGVANDIRIVLDSVHGTVGKGVHKPEETFVANSGLAKRSDVSHSDFGEKGFEKEKTNAGQCSSERMAGDIEICIFGADFLD